MANLWLQNFDTFKDNKLAKSPTARPKSTRVPKANAQSKPTTVPEPSVPERKNKEVQEVSSTGHSDTPAALTFDMVEQWATFFYEAVNQTYAYDPSNGEQNR